MRIKSRFGCTAPQPTAADTDSQDNNSDQQLALLLGQKGHENTLLERFRAPCSCLMPRGAGGLALRQQR